MKKFTFFFALATAVSFANAQALQGVIVEKYYSTNSADSTNAANNGAVTILHSGSITYRVFLDMAPGYKFVQMFGNSDALGNVIHPMVIKTTTDFYNDPIYGQIFPQGTSTVNTKKNTTLIDSYLSVGGVCAGKMGVLKTEDTDGSIGNSTGILTNDPGGVFGAPINSVNANAQDGMLPGTPIAPNALGLGNSTDIFYQTAGNTFSVTNGSVAGLGGVVGVTPSNMVLIGQFTTDGIFSFSLNVQLSNTVTNQAEVFVHSSPQASETVVPSLIYTSAGTNTNTGTGIASVIQDDLSGFSIYPNPARDFFIISANVKENTAVSYSIYDVTGRLIASKDLGKVHVNFSETVNTADFKKGIYLVSISANGVVSTRRVVKE